MWIAMFRWRPGTFDEAETRTQSGMVKFRLVVIHSDVTAGSSMDAPCAKRFDGPLLTSQSQLYFRLLLHDFFLAHVSDRAVLIYACQMCLELAAIGISTRI